jgi:GntR family transcriptional regulator/MocR family aminotransferase
LRSSRELDSEAISWLPLNPHPGETLRGALERALRDAILEGALRAKVRLPASRVLASDLGISRGVVSDAYEQLQAQGFLVTRARSAPVVAVVGRPPTRLSIPSDAPTPPRFDLTPTTPDVRLFPVAHWLSAVRDTTRRAQTGTFDYREPQGERVLRNRLADYLGRTRGVVADPAQIVVVQGTAQGFDLVLRLLRNRGALSVAVEDPGHTTQSRRVRAAGLRLKPQAVDDAGLVLRGLNADAVLVTPAHQFPTGSVMSGERRRQLLAWGRVNARLIVEDDYDAEFRYDREPVRALQGLGPRQVIHLGTVSKTLAPALRLGWIVVPPDLVDDARQTKALLDDFSPVLDQLALAELIRRGDYDRHIRRARRIYRARRDRVLGALRQHLPDLTIDGAAAGMHVVLRFPAQVDDGPIAKACVDAGIAVPSLSSFSLTPSAHNGLVIGYGRLHESAVDDAVRALAGVVRHSLTTGR